MKSILMFSLPGWSIATPTCAGPMLAGYLKAKGFVADVIDLNSLHIVNFVKGFNNKPISPEQILSLNKIALNDFIEDVDLYSIYGKSELELTLPELINTPSSKLEKFIIGELEKASNHLKKYDIFGISVSLTRQLYSALVVAKTAKEMFPDKTIVIGGSAISPLWEQITNSKKIFDYFDMVIKEDGSTPLLEILNGNPVEEIHSIAYRKDDVIYINNLSKIPNDLYCYPPFYRPEYIKNYPKPLILPIPANIGCWHNKCSFCTYPTAKKYNYKFWGANYIVDQMEHLKFELGVDSFYFTGAGLTPDHFWQVARLINERNLKINWTSESLVSEFSNEIISEMEKSGCTQIDFGLESASMPIRDFLNKGIGLDRFRSTLDTIRKSNFRGVTVNIIISTPVTKKKDLQETLKLLKEYEDIIFFTYQFNLEIQLSSDYYRTFHNFSEQIIKSRPDTLVKLFPYKLLDDDILSFWREEFGKIKIGGLYTREKRIDGGVVDMALSISNGSRTQWEDMKLLLKNIDNRGVSHSDTLRSTRFL
ncbi:MAG: radical SAM protein [Desulfobacteraceae bacterium]|nr:radical SAM protein [Desulfobacteraceae bacterium]